MTQTQPGNEKKTSVEPAYLLGSVGAGDRPPSQANVMVEIPRVGSVKYEVDQRTGLVFVDRFLYTATHHPFNYGFIPGTKGEDGGYLDALVITNEPVYPMSVLQSRTIGALLRKDEKGPDSNIVAAPDKNTDPAYSSLSDVGQLPDFALKQIDTSSPIARRRNPASLSEFAGRAGRSPKASSARPRSPSKRDSKS